MRKLMAALIAALLILLAAPAFGDLPPPCGEPALELAWQQHEWQYEKTALNAAMALMEEAEHSRRPSSSDDRHDYAIPGHECE